MNNRSNILITYYISSSAGAVGLYCYIWTTTFLIKWGLDQDHS